MSRNGSGTMAIPNTFVARTTAKSADVNENFSDIGDEITNSVAADGQTSMTGALKAFAGTEALPGIAFATDTDTGFRRSAADTMKAVIGGNDVFQIDGDGITMESGKSFTPSGPIEYTARVDVASAATTDIGAAASNYVRITGTETITAFDDATVGTVRDVLFGGILRLTYGATSIITLTGASRTTAAGDTAKYVKETDGWRELTYNSTVAVGYMPIGMLFMWPADTTPSGALVRDGSEVSRTTYADLYALVGDTYGDGDGSTTFNLPDDRGLFERGWSGADGTIDADREFGSTQADAFQGHEHTYNRPNQNNSTSGSTSNVQSSTPAPTDGIVTNGTNGAPRVADETRPYNRAYLPCIRAY